ncbi:hypothetical protein GQ600_8885 [Phytophthora cactorum]|nr:hypothetical protein GQ600_8885 [Phytophthora cactorum]
MAVWVKARETLLENMFGYMMQPIGFDLQNAYYNGWPHAGFVTGTKCFGADGCILWANHNYPES